MPSSSHLSERPLLSQSRMLPLLAVLLTVGFVLATTISYLVSRNSIRKAILEEELPLTSDNIYSEIQRDLFEPILISSLMANDTFLKDWILAGESESLQIQQYLAAIQERYGTISSFLVTEESRRYYHPDGILKVVQEANPVDAWFFRVRNMTPDYEINVDPDMANRDAMTIFINYRVLDSEGRFLGATGVGLTVNAVKELMADYEKRFHRRVSFYDREGRIVLHSFGSNEAAEAAMHAKSAAFLTLRREIDAGRTGEPISVVDSRGSLVNYRYIPELDWILVVEQRADGTRPILFKTFGLNLLICLATAAVVLTIIHLAILRYQQRIERRNFQLESQNRQIEEQAADLQKANAKLDAMHREKDEFIGITAHDLKTPLHSILGFCRLLVEEEPLSAEGRESVESITTAGSRMLERVEALLHLSELESNQSPALEPVDASLAILQAVGLHRAHASAKQIRFDLQLPDSPLPVMAHEKWLVEIFSNLLSNAVKYSPPGGRVTIATTLREDGLREIRVRDEGEGIDPARQSRLFEKFSRLGSKPTAGESSSGLGLYIVKLTTDRMGGRVRCESAKGAGATFVVAFPVAEIGLPTESTARG